MLLPLLLACTTPKSTHTEDTADTATPETGVPLDWGVVDACDGRPSGSFNDWFTADTALLVYGTAPEDRALAERVLGWYGSLGPAIELRAAIDLTEDDARENLLILGSPDTNPLLAAMNGSLPVWFEEGAFTFGGYRYTEPGHGIALMHPNPWNADGHVLLFAGNTWDGAFSTFTVRTGGTDYVTTRGRGVVQQSGSLCREDTPWSWVEGGRWDEDLRADWEAWTAGLESSSHLDGAEITLTYRYLPGSDAAADVDALLDARAADYAYVLATLDLAPLDAPIVSYLYPDNATKGEVTGNDGNAHANDLNHEVHEVYGADVHAATGHEDVHVIAWHRIGETSYALMGEGLAVGMGGVWWSEPLDDWATGFADADEIPPLAALITDFWSYEDPLTYPLAGHFVLFLLDGWGPDTLKALYVADDLDAAFVTELGLTTDEVEAAWRASIP